MRGASPSTPPTTPVLPLSVWRRTSLSHGVYPVRRSPQGAIGAHLPASRAICAPAAALPLRGDRLRAPARWVGGIFFGFRVARRGASPSAWRFPSDRRKVISSVSAYKRFFLPLACGFSPASGCGSLRGWRQGVRGASPSTPPATPVLPLVSCGGGRRCRMSYTLSAARRMGQSARIFPLRGRYARLLRRSRVAGIASAPRLAGLVFFSGFRVARRGASPSAWRFPSDRRKVISSVSAYKRFFLPLAGGFSPASGCGSLRGWRQGVRGASPSTPPTTPVLPFSVWRRASLSHVVYLVRRSPHGAIGAHLPASRAICAPAAALPLRGDRLRAPAHWAGGIFFGFRVARRGASPPA